MKKMALVLSIAVLLSSFAYAQTAVDDNVDRDMTILRKKLGQMKRQMDLLVRDLTSTVPAAGEAVVGTFGNDVYVDILQTDQTIVVKADLPGMDKDKIDVMLDSDRFLKISGTRSVEKVEKSSGVVRQERFFGNFSKVIELPAEVTPVGISAVYKNGVLEITIPKKAKSPKEEPVKISVK